MLKRGDLLAVLHAYPAAGLAHHPLCDHALGAFGNRLCTADANANSSDTASLASSIDGARIDANRRFLAFHAVA